LEEASASLEETFRFSEEAFWFAVQLHRKHFRKMFQMSASLFFDTYCTVWSRHYLLTED